MGSSDAFFRPLRHLRSQQEGQPLECGWKTQLYSSLYNSISKSSCTPPPPCDGHDWGSVFGFGFSVDGSLLAAACENKSLLLYDPLNMRLITRKYNVHTDCVNCVKFLDNRLFATCSDDQTVRLWDMRNLKQEFRVLHGHSSWVKNIEYAASSGKLVTSGFDGNIFSWDINNYTESDSMPEPVLHISGIMRTVLTPAADKMIISALGGYFVLIHNLNLNTLKEDMRGFKPHLTRIMQVLKVPLSSMANKHIFTRDRNRVEYMWDFPPSDSAESISTMEVHPHGWCVASRNTTLEEDAEWTCIHDIQTSSRSKHSFRASRSQQETSDSDRSTSNERPSHCSQGRRISSGTQTTNPELFTSSLSGGSGGMHYNVACHIEANRTSGEDTDFTDEEEDVNKGQLFNVSQNNSLGNSDTSANGEQTHLGQTSQSTESQTNSESALGSFMGLSSISLAVASSTTVNSTPNSVRDNHWPLRILMASTSRYRQNEEANTTTPPRPRPLKYRHGKMKRRLLYYSEEPNVGLGFIKEQGFSPEGRVLASPFGNSVRLLAFNESCEELYDCVPQKPKSLHQIKLTSLVKSTVLASAFCPTQFQLVVGARDGTVSFCSPKL